MHSKHVPFYDRTYFIFICAALASVALSSWLAISETVINSDGICYLLSANEVGRGGLRAAMHICGQARWPLYSVLIYGFSQLSHTSTMFSAYFLNGIFSLISVLAFVAIVAEMGASRRVLWLAALTILLAHDFNAVRQYIVRDHGFYAFYLMSLFFMLRYFRKPVMLNALFWSGSILVATLFRIEGAVFFVLMPFAALLNVRHTWSQRCVAFLKLNVVVLFTALAIVAWYFTHPAMSLDKLGRIPELYTEMQRSFSAVANRWHYIHLGLEQHVLDGNSFNQATMFTNMIVIMGYFFNVLSVISPLYALLALYAWVAHAAFWTRNDLLVVLSYLVTNILITVIFYAQHLFLSRRYVIAMAIVLMLWVPYGLDKLLRKAHRRHYRIAATAAVVWLLIASLGGIFDFGYSKAYIHKAGDWLARNTSRQAEVYVNNGQLMYYSRLFGQDLFKKSAEYQDVRLVLKEKWRQYDYLAFVVKDKADQKVVDVLKSKGLTVARSFHNKRRDRAVILKTPLKEKSN